MKSIEKLRRKIAALMAGPKANQNDISFIDVKALYDAAYAEKDKARACLKTFKTLLDKAERLDAAYRQQLKAEHTRLYGKAA